MSKKEDLNLISKSLSYVFGGRMDNIFSRKEILKGVSLVSFDNNFLYLFTIENNVVNIKEISHREDILDKTKRGWSAYLRQKGELKKYLPESCIQSKIVSGGLFSDFVALQGYNQSIYTAKEAYIATIIHEFAHVYFNKLNPFYYADKEYNLEILELSRDLYLKKPVNLEYTISIPSYADSTEVFAFCAEYEYARKYAKKYFDSMNEEFSKQIDCMLEEEKLKNLEKEDSVLVDPHSLSFVIGKLIVEKYPDDWAGRLIKRLEI